jgi:uncharacterized protein YycO
MYVLMKSNSEKKLTNLKNKYQHSGISIQTKVIADAKGSGVNNIIKNMLKKK